MWGTVESASGKSYLVEAIPRGVVQSRVLDNWVMQSETVLPLVASVVGYLRHRIKYRGQWLVLVRARTGEREGPILHQKIAPDRKSAGRLLDTTAALVRSGDLDLSGNAAPPSL